MEENNAAVVSNIKTEKVSNNFVRVSIGSSNYDIPMNELQQAVTMYVNSNDYDDSTYSDSFKNELESKKANIEKMNPYNMSDDIRNEYDKFLSNAIASYLVSTASRNINNYLSNDNHNGTVEYEIGSTISSNEAEAKSLASNIKLASNKIFTIHLILI